jgi:putative DNA primase/helicase
MHCRFAGWEERAVKALCPNIKLMRAHIDWLIAPVHESYSDLRIEIAWSDAKGKVNQARTFALNQVDEAVAFAAKKNIAPTNVYVGTILKAVGTPSEGRTSSLHSALATALAIDVDENADEAAAKLDLLLDPALIVRTGAVPQPRFQFWFRVRPSDDLFTFGSIVKSAVAYCGGDTNATGLNRVMRLAGSVSYPHANKRDRGYVDELTQAKFFEAPSYTLEELTSLLPEKKRKARQSVDMDAAVGHGLRSQTTIPTPPHAQEMRAMLKHLYMAGYFVKRNEWRNAGMALKISYGEETGFELWAETHADDRAREDAPSQWESFASEAQPGHVTLGTIIKAAKYAGFSLKEAGIKLAIGTSTNKGDQIAPNAVAELNFTGEGGDLYNGAVFANSYHGKLLFIHETNEVLRFDESGGWLAAAPGTAERAAKDVVRVLKDAANGKAQLSHVTKLCDLKVQRAMIEMAKSEPGMTVRLSQFDDDPMLLGMANGVLDLRKGKLMPVSPEVLVSKRCNVSYDPDAQCPRFDKFMEEVQPDAEVRAFLQRLVGYCLTGRVDAQVFAFLYGHGANGKSVFVEMIAWLLGDYACKIQTEMLMHHQRNPQGPSPEIVALKGRRFAYANETEEGGRLAQARVRELTGGDTLTGRVPYGKAAITFEPNHKLFMVGNHKPEITDTSSGMWRRVVLVPFDQTILEAKRDPHLLEKLKAEGSGVLNWALDGLRAFLKDGLKVPCKIKAATAAYREEQDVIGEWIAENCRTGTGLSVPKRDLYLNYKFWIEENGHRPLSQSKLTRRLNERGYQLAKDKRTVNSLALR